MNSDAENNWQDSESSRSTEILMKCYLFFVICVCISTLFASCGSKKSSNQEVETVPLSTLINRKKYYEGKKVIVSSYLFPHEEGPWLAPDLSKPLENTLALQITNESVLVPLNKTSSLWWFESHVGVQAVVTGVLRMRNIEKVKDHMIYDQPYLEVIAAKEIR